ncbi:hypothetical protein LCGC14_2769820 [marine sediment metagenome]|uniref:Uncharacterized protein n=1 Tax=marine sediment metagenome TaxID=412755 RepID=A0A0F9B5A5_9ZZZZ
MSYKDRLSNWVEERIFQDDETGKFRIYDPNSDELEDKLFDDKDEIRDVLWDRACALDGTEIYGVDV